VLGRVAGIPLAGVKDRGGAALERVAGIPLAGVKDREGAALERAAGIPLAGVKDRGTLLGRGAVSPVTTVVPPIGVGFLEDGGGGRVETIPPDGVSDRGVVLGREGASVAIGVPLTGVDRPWGAVLGCVAAVGWTLECTAGVPPAGVGDRGGSELVRVAAAAAMPEATAGVPAGVEERCAPVPVGAEFMEVALDAGGGAVGSTFVGCTGAGAAFASPQSSSISSVDGTRDRTEDGLGAFDGATDG
jgi:hypothetical protein